MVEESDADKPNGKIILMNQFGCSKQAIIQSEIEFFFWFERNSFDAQFTIAIGHSNLPPRRSLIW